MNPLFLAVGGIAAIAALSRSRQSDAPPQAPRASAPPQDIDLGPMPTFAPSTPTPVANLMQQDLATATYALQERCKNNPAVASVTQGNDHIIVALIDNGSAVAIPGQFLGWPVRFVDT